MEHLIDNFKQEGRREIDSLLMELSSQNSGRGTISDVQASLERYFAAIGKLNDYLVQKAHTN